MNHHSFYAALLVMTLSLTACHNKTSDKVAATPDSTAVTTPDSPQAQQPSAEDLTLKSYSRKFKTKHFSYDIDILLAESPSNPTLAHAINEWVNEQLGGKYEGRLNDGKAMLDFYLKTWVKEEEKDIDNGENSQSITKVYETDEFLTLEMQTYWYEGGAHGGASLVGATFRKSDARKFDKSMLFNDKSLNRHMVNGLIKAFEVKNRQELAENLMVSSLVGIDDAESKLEFLPLPNTQPWLTKGGLKLVYQQYEIGPYVVGMPTVTIPYKQLPALLNATGKTYLK